MSGFIRFIKKQHFWLIVPVLLIVMAVAWMMASKEAIATFDTGQSTIDGHFSKMQSVQAISPHPNQWYTDGMQQMIQERAADVDAAWATLYAKQVGTMKWSKELDAPLIAKVEKFRPIEAVVEETRGTVTFRGKTEKIEDWVLSAYRNFVVDKELARLAETIGSSWVAVVEEATAGGAGYGDAGGIGPPGGGGGDAEGATPAGGYGRPVSGYGTGGGGYGGYGGSGGGDGGYGGFGDDEMSPNIVQWSAESQQAILANSFGWAARGTGKPSVLEMLYSQEDIWVLDSLMHAIKETNGDAMHSSQAVIKEIISLNIGKSVKTSSGKISAVQSASSEDDEGGVFMDSGGGDPYSDPYGAMDFGGEDDFGDEEGDFSGPSPLDQRYVNANYEKLLAEDLNANAESTDLNLVAVAKRMPVRMRLRMDARKIPEVLAACANAPLTFEVHQVRVNPEDDANAGGGGGMMMGYGAPAGGGGDGATPAGGGYGGYGGYGGAGGGGYGGYGAAGGSSDGGGYGGMDDEERPAETYDKPVEFFGIIYIYNPVDKTKLGTDKADEQPEDNEVAGI